MRSSATASVLQGPNCCCRPLPHVTATYQVEVQTGPSEMMFQLMRLIGQGAFDGREAEIDAIDLSVSDKSEA